MQAMVWPAVTEKNQIKAQQRMQAMLHHDKMPEGKHVKYLQHGPRPSRSGAAENFPASHETWLTRPSFGLAAHDLPGHQEHCDSEAAVVESREPQPRPAAACYGPVSRPGSPLRSGALGLARASLLAPSRLLPKKQLLWSEE